ncbi:MAG TPA: class I SAM-dependent methyltransferase [Acidimicrobiia bacterium]
MAEHDNTFEAVAPTYDAIRPAYPEAVFDTIESYLSSVARHPHVLEVGVGTGQATVQMAAREWRVFGVEPGAQLAATARSRLAAHDLVTVATATFEAIDVADASFDLVASATAWHWVDPKVGYAKAHRVLEPDGAIALWWNAHVPDTTDPRWEPVRTAYERAAPELARLARLTPDRPDYDPAGELHDCGRFEAVEQHIFSFSLAYSAREFLDLISTYASHRHLDPPRRQRLVAELTDVIDGELGGTVVKPYEAQLVLARPIR